MGIVNLTPDSFSDGGLLNTNQKALQKIQELNLLKTDIIDIGAESTRPNAIPISSQQEWARLENILKNIKNLNLKSKISLDTYKPEIALKALKLNSINIINDVSSLQDLNMLNVLKQFPETEIILNHNWGIPLTNQNRVFNKNTCLSEIINFFEEKIKLLNKINFKQKQIILDIGLGFGKSLEENLFFN